MCGILGVAGRGPQDVGAVERWNRRMRHRGPDDNDVWLSSDGGTALGHCRLSIIDLSPAGHQPMPSADGRLHIVFNGEIYNYRDLRDELRARGHVFRSQSDTEVLLEGYRAWGAAVVPRLLGQFAFAIHDETAGTIFAARDRAGEKPFFYRHDAGALRFASELKALMADAVMPRRLDAAALQYYLAFGYVPGDMCMLDGVHKLPPAHLLHYDIARDALRIERYWSLPDPVDPRLQADAGALTDELEALLQDAVRRQLVADVPVGVLLSGGTDSSIITALAARANHGALRTFTVRFPGHGAYDEGPFARQVAEHLGTDHTELVAEAASVELLPELARQFDEPLADSSMIPTYMVARLIRQHATVALGGDGGDELFGGYPHHSWLMRQEQLRRFIPSPARALLQRAGAAMPYGIRGRNWMISLPDSRAAAVAAVNVYFDRALRARLLPAALHGRGETPEQFRTRLGAFGHTVLQAACAVDFTTYLPDDLLVKVDRASMLASLEVRAPFLDHRVVEFAFGRVPDALRATASERKVLLRALGRRLLPRTLDLRRKQGFSIPLGSWMTGATGVQLRGMLRDAPWFDAATVDELFRQQARGRNNAQRIYALAMLELWRREYDVQAPS